MCPFTVFRIGLCLNRLSRKASIVHLFSFVPNALCKIGQWEQNSKKRLSEHPLAPLPSSLESLFCWSSDLIGFEYLPCTYCKTPRRGTLKPQAVSSQLLSVSVYHENVYSKYPKFLNIMRLIFNLRESSRYHIRSDLCLLTC